MLDVLQHITPISPRRPSLKRIDAVVSARLGPGRVAGNQRTPAFYRQVAMYLAHVSFGWPQQTVGRFYDRHHTCVVHAVRKINALLPKQQKLTDFLAELQEQIADQAIDSSSLSLVALDIDTNALTDYELDQLADLVWAKLFDRMQRNSDHESRAVGA